MNEQRVDTCVCVGSEHVSVCANEPVVKSRALAIDYSIHANVVATLPDIETHQSQPNDPVLLCQKDVIDFCELSRGQRGNGTGSGGGRTGRRTLASPESPGASTSVTAES
ncbi:hypothetical protein CBL_05871 [Carabus blaptoides fortunei]